MDKQKPLAVKVTLWQLFGGPLLTLGTLAGLELLAQSKFRIPNPPVIYLTLVVYAAFSGGLISGLISAAITLLYAFYFFSVPGQLFHYTPDNGLRVLVLIVATPAMALMVGILKLRTERMLDAVRISALQQTQLAEQLRTLHKASRLVNSDLRLDAILQKLVETARYLSNANYAALALIDKDGKQIQFEDGWGLFEQTNNGQIESSALMNIALLNHEPLRLGDLMLDPHLAGILSPHPEMKAFMGVPIVNRGKILGGLVLVNDDPFTYEDEELVVALAADAAIAIENARLFAEIQLLATTDELTGIDNRHHFLKLANIEFDRAHRYGNNLSIILLDIDHFKHVNDTYGHNIGDQVIREVASRCKKSLRTIDRLSRYGGEEFAVFLPENDLYGAVSAAERLRLGIAETPIETTQGPLAITISLGVAAYNQNCPDLITLINQADAALYLAKNAGRNQVKTSESSN